jgi:CBS domain-containing protein
VHLTHPNETLVEAAKTMALLDAGALPVRDGDRLVGMITDRDIAVRGVALGKRPDATVAEVMSREVLYCYEDQEVEEVLRNMGQVQVRRLPVLDRNKRLVGIVSLADLAASGPSRFAADALGDIARPGGRHSQHLH